MQQAKYPQQNNQNPYNQNPLLNQKEQPKKLTIPNWLIVLTLIIVAGIIYLILR